MLPSFSFDPKRLLTYRRVSLTRIDTLRYDVLLKNLNLKATPNDCFPHTINWVAPLSRLHGQMPKPANLPRRALEKTQPNG